MDSDDYDLWKQRAKVVVDRLQQITAFVLSHVGLLCVVVVYAIIGAVIFVQLEQPNERNLCFVNSNNFHQLEASMVDRLWLVSSSYTQASDQDAANTAFRGLLDEFKDAVLGLQQNGFSTTNCTLLGQPGGPSYQWSYLGALFFVCTVFTTIGYGNIAPKTSWGRIVCICYAVVGIPLMLLTLANLGDAFARLFRFVYTEVCCCGGFRPAQYLTPTSSARHSRNVSVKSTSDNMNMLASVSRANSPLDKSGKGGLHEVWKNQFTSAISNSGDLVAHGANNSILILSEDENVENETDVEDIDINNEDYNEISVPLTIILAVIAGYIVGTLLFGLWEGWDPLTAAYYCFITIATIGFGDVVPSYSNPGQQYILLGTALYMLLGMATLSMCFTLVQDQMASKFRKLREKVRTLLRRLRNASSNSDEVGNHSRTSSTADDDAYRRMVMKLATILGHLLQLMMTRIVEW